MITFRSTFFILLTFLFNFAFAFDFNKGEVDFLDTSIIKKAAYFTIHTEKDCSTCIKKRVEEYNDCDSRPSKYCKRGHENIQMYLSEDKWIISFHDIEGIMLAWYIICDVNRYKIDDLESWAGDDSQWIIGEDDSLAFWADNIAKSDLFYGYPFSYEKRRKWVVVKDCLRVWAGLKLDADAKPKAILFFPVKCIKSTLVKNVYLDKDGYRLNTWGDFTFNVEKDIDATNAVRRKPTSSFHRFKSIFSGFTEY